MARLFPFRSDTDPQEGHPRIVELEGEDADAVFGALSSTTARRIYAQLDEEPGTPSDVADAVDSSIQNVRYHLENLEDAGLVEVVDTWYSSRGNEMSVYATTDGPLIVTSDESTASQLKTALSRLLGGVGALAGGSLLVQYGLVRWLGSTGTEGANSGSDSGMAPAGDDAADLEAADESMTEDGNGNGDGATMADDDGATSAEDDMGAQDAEDDGMTTQENGADGARETDAEASGNAATTDDAETDAPTESAEDLDVTGDVDGGYLTGESAGDSAEAADAVFSVVPPGALFFLGGLVVLLAVWCYWYWYRPTHRL